MISEVEREKRKAYLAANKERIRAKQREYRAAHREEIKEKEKAWIEAHREEVNARNRKYVKEHWNEVSKWHKAALKRMETRMGETYYQKYSREHKEQMREYNLSRKAYIEARCVTNRAIRRGELVRLPCENCGEQQSEAHHIDYNKPLEVMWLCRRYHRDWHRNHTAIPPKNS